MSNEITDTLWKIVDKRLGRLAFGCLGCPKIEECEDSEGVESRYCESLIRAAVLGEIEFKIPWPI